jgi:uncharacterized RDD family membrane protein YckC
MKCPKCLYIGFETGDRCKNCGYDFSLLALADEPVEPAPEPALDLTPALGETWSGPVIDRFRDLPDSEGPAMTLAGPAIEDDREPPSPVMSAPAELAGADVPALPLFSPDGMDDEPLVKLPVSPRPPLSVRRTPEIPRLRPMAPVERSLDDDVVLQFVEEPEGDLAGNVVMDDDEESIATARRPSFRVDPAADASPFGRRAVAAMIDHGILLGIDLVVLYFTLRLTDLTFADWKVLPWLPLAAFLLSLKVAYLSAFTTAGGQTIGKMATHIRVVSEDGGGLDPGRALRRAVLELVSIATAGAPFLTAMTDPLRRGVHDRASGTRVVALPSH